MTSLASRTLLAVLLASTAACSADAPTAGPSATPTASPSAPNLRRSGSSSAVAVAGLWDGVVPSDQPNVTREWTLNLVQRDEKLEGSLTQITTNETGTYYSTTELESGSLITGRTITVRFAVAANAETKATYTATLSADGRSMTGTYAFAPGPITLVRR